MLLSLRGATAELFKLINMETLISPDVLIPASICARDSSLPSSQTFRPPYRTEPSFRWRAFHDTRSWKNVFLFLRMYSHYDLRPRYTKFLRDYFTMELMKRELRMGRVLLIFMYSYYHHFSSKYIMNFNWTF